jgi:hypothetical protein
MTRTDALNDNISDLFEERDPLSPRMINFLREEIKSELRDHFVCLDKIKTAGREVFERSGLIPSVFFEGRFYCEPEYIKLAERELV